MEQNKSTVAVTPGTVEVPVIKFTCLKCQREYELPEEAPGKALGWLCAACWIEQHGDDEKMKQGPG